MAISSGFFNSLNGDRKYNADEMTLYFDGLVSDGIYENVEDAFIVEATGNGLEITIGAGRAICNKRWIKNDAALSVTLSPANVRYPRIDSVFIRCDMNARSVTVEIVEGTPAQNPQTPQPVRNASIKDLFVASVRVDANAVSLSQSKITDYRASSLCGWVTGIIKQVDTSELFMQYHTAYEEQLARMHNWEESQKQAFESWFAALTETLNINTKLRKYVTYVGLGNPAPQVALIEQYEEGDVLLVHINGLLLTEGTEYEILDGSVIFAHTLSAGTIVTQILVKSVIGL